MPGTEILFEAEDEVSLREWVAGIETVTQKVFSFLFFLNKKKKKKKKETEPKWKLNQFYLASKKNSLYSLYIIKNIFESSFSILRVFKIKAWKKNNNMAV